MMVLLGLLVVPALGPGDGGPAALSEFARRCRGRRLSRRRSAPVSGASAPLTSTVSKSSMRPLVGSSSADPCAGRLPQLDALRGIAAFMVVLHHGLLSLPSGASLASAIEWVPGFAHPRPRPAWPWSCSSC